MTDIGKLTLPNCLSVSLSGARSTSSITGTTRSSIIGVAASAFATPLSPVPEPPIQTYKAHTIALLRPEDCLTGIDLMKIMAGAKIIYRGRHSS